MAWQMVDDLTGDVVPEQDAQVLELTLRPRGAHVADVVAAWDVAATDPGVLLPQLGEHLSGTAAPLRMDPEQLPVSEQTRDALRQAGVMVCGPGEIDVDDETPTDVPLGRRIHEGLRTLDLPWRVEIALRRLGYRLAAALEGAMADDDACPHDPDGLHFPTCGCDGVDPLNPNEEHGWTSPASPSPTSREKSSDAEDPNPARAESGRATSGSGTPTATPDAVPAASAPSPAAPADSSTETPDGAVIHDTGTSWETSKTPITSDQVGEAAKGRATDATIRIWAQAWNVPCSTTGGLKKWVREGYERVRGGQPDAATWAHAGIPAPQTSSSARPGDETPAPSDPNPPAGRAVAGTPSPDRAGRGPAPTPAPGGEAGAGVGAAGDHVRPEQRDLAEEMAADGASPKAIVDATGVPLALARELAMSGKGGS